MNKFKSKRFVIVAIFAVCMLAGGVIGGIYLTNDSDAKVAKEDTVTIIDKETGEKEVVEADSEEAKEAAKDPEVKVVANETSKQEAAKATTNAKSSSTKSSSAKTTTNTNKNSGKNSASSAKSSSSSSSKGSAASSSGSSQTTKPQHTHNWQPVYKTVTKYRTEYRTREVMICNTCGADITSVGMRAHDEASNYKCHGSHGDVVTETVEVPYTEQVLSHYACSCGATK